MAPLTADFGPFAILLKVQNTPLREHPVSLAMEERSILGKTAREYPMTPLQKKMLQDMGPGRVTLHYPLGEYTTFRAGGPVEALYEAHTLAELIDLITFLAQEKIPYFVIGRGSNMLVPDEGLDAVAISLKGEFLTIEVAEGDAQGLLVGAGASIFDLLDHCRVHGLSGVEFLAGIPGTAGGAVAMNAGAFGREIGEKVAGVELINGKGQKGWLNRERLHFSYRHFERPAGAVITRVLFSLEKESGERIRQRIVEYLKKKKAQQPLELPSAGSVFKNPPGHYAGKLIEEAGLKGKRIGGAMISPKHANFIVNTGQAKAADILALIRTAREKVKARFGVDLDLEIEVLG